MTHFYLVRHGETNWPAMRARCVTGRAKNFAELTPAGIAQIEALAGDPGLKSAEAILASPYTRAMQTAAILSRRLNLPLHVEYDLHEWLFDRDASVDFVAEEVERRRQQFFESDRRAQPTEAQVWESACEVRERVEAALGRYRLHATLIVACHVGVIYALTGQTKVGLGEIVEYAA